MLLGLAVALSTIVLLLPGVGAADDLAPAVEVEAYVYVPGAVTVTGEASSEEWLANAEAAFGVESQSASDDPARASRPELAVVDRAAHVLSMHWKELDRACDPDAVFALMYLETTYTVRDHIAADFFDDNAQLAVVTVAFAQLYLDAYHAWHEGDARDVPGPWREAFAAADEERTSVLEDMFLGMNGHINYDLAVAMWQTGIDASRKPDHDRINRVLLAAAPRVNARIAEEYDPSREPSSGAEDDPFTHTVLWPVYDWREAAWRNAEALTAGVPASIVTAEMDAHGRAVAQAFQSPKSDGAWEARMEYCQAH